MEVPQEVRRLVIDARDNAGYAHQMSEGLAEVLNGLSTRGAEVDSSALIFLAEGAKSIAARLAECDAKLGEVAEATSTPGMP